MRAASSASDTRPREGVGASRSSQGGARECVPARVSASARGVHLAGGRPGATGARGRGRHGDAARHVPAPRAGTSGFRPEAPGESEGRGGAAVAVQAQVLTVRAGVGGGRPKGRGALMSSTAPSQRPRAPAPDPRPSLTAPAPRPRGRFSPGPVSSVTARSRRPEPPSLRQRYRWWSGPKRP